MTIFTPHFTLTSGKMGEVCKHPKESQDRHPVSITNSIMDILKGLQTICEQPEFCKVHTHLKGVLTQSSEQPYGF